MLHFNLRGCCRWLAQADQLVVVANDTIQHCGSYHALITAGVDLTAIMGVQAPVAEQPVAHDPPVQVLESPPAAVPRLSVLSEASSISLAPDALIEEEGLTKSEDRETGVIALKVWTVYPKLLGIGVSLLILLLLGSSSGLNVAGSWVLNQWSSHSGKRIYRALGMRNCCA